MADSHMRCPRFIPRVLGGGGHGESCALGPSLGSLSERLEPDASSGGGVALGSRGWCHRPPDGCGGRGSLQEAKEWAKAKVRTGDSAEAPFFDQAKVRKCRVGVDYRSAEWGER